MRFRKIITRIMLTFTTLIVVFTISVSAKTQGITSGVINFFPNYIINSLTQIPALGANAETRAEGLSIDNITWIEAKISHGSLTSRKTGTKQNHRKTDTIIVGPNTGKYTVYSFHDVQTKTARSYFNYSRAY